MTDSPRRGGRLGFLPDRSAGPCGLCVCRMAGRLRALVKEMFLNYFGCTGSLLLRRLSLIAVSRASSSLCCTDFSLWCLLLLCSMGSRLAGSSSCSLYRGSGALEHRLSCPRAAYRICPDQGSNACPLGLPSPLPRLLNEASCDEVCFVKLY